MKCRIAFPCSEPRRARQQPTDRYAHLANIYIYFKFVCQRYPPRKVGQISTGPVRVCFVADGAIEHEFVGFDEIW